jgi:glutamyl-tRNA synthetase
LLLKPDGKGKLSKRDGDRLGFPVFPLQWVNSEGEVSRGYREDGYFPEAFVNLLAMLGWNPGNDQEMFSLEELVGAFSLERVIKSGARFNADKAKWYNKEYLRLKDVESLTEAFIPMLEERGLKIVDCPACAITAGAQMTVTGADFENKIFSRQYVERIVALIKERATFVADFWDIAPYLFVAPESFVEKDAAKFWKEENYTLALQVADFIINFEGEFTKENLEGPLEEYIRGNEWPMGKVMNCLRLAMVGGSNGLGIADIVTLIGKNEFAKRIEFIKATLGC